MIDAFRDKLVYLATPYTDYGPGPMQGFADAAKLAGRLIALGMTVYCPIAHSHPIAFFARLDGRDRGLWLPQCLVLLRRCDVLVVAQLPGWDTSRGIAAEVADFLPSGKPIYDLDPASLMMTRRKPPLAVVPAGSAAG